MSRPKQKDYNDRYAQRNKIKLDTKKYKSMIDKNLKIIATLTQSRFDTQIIKLVKEALNLKAKLTKFEISLLDKNFGVKR